MRNKLIFLLVALSVSAFGVTPIANLKLIEDANGNGQSITNLNSIFTDYVQVGQEIVTSSGSSSINPNQGALYYGSNGVNNISLNWLSGVLNYNSGGFGLSVDYAHGALYSNLESNNQQVATWNDGVLRSSQSGFPYATTDLLDLASSKTTNLLFYTSELTITSVSNVTIIPITSQYKAYKVIVTNSTDIAFGGISDLNLTNEFPTVEVRLVITDPALSVTLPASGVGGVYYPETIDLTTTITNTTHYLSVRPYATNDVIVTRWLYREP